MLKDASKAQINNVANAERIVTKAINENIPSGFRHATDEQIKKLLVNIISNYTEVEDVELDLGEYE